MATETGTVTTTATAKAKPVKQEFDVGSDVVYYAPSLRARSIPTPRHPVLCLVIGYENGRYDLEDEVDVYEDVENDDGYGNKVLRKRHDNDDLVWPLRGFNLSEDGNGYHPTIYTTTYWHELSRATLEQIIRELQEAKSKFSDRRRY